MRHYEQLAEMADIVVIAAAATSAGCAVRFWLGPRDHAAMRWRWAYWLFAFLAVAASRWV
jgi:hypothetical protein